MTSIIRSQKELITMMSSTTDMMTILLACIAGISLFVGGIGIMNIMYVSVTERTREIGLRMSIGAKGFDILMQFLIESILLSVTGGVIERDHWYWQCIYCEKYFSMAYRYSSLYYSFVFYSAAIFL